MPADGWRCPPHRVRISTRARRISLRLSAFGELEVVLPKGARGVNVAELLYQKRAWLEAARARLGNRLPPSDPGIPERIELRALAQIWRVSHASDAALAVRVLDADTLIVGGAPEPAREALRLWLIDMGRRHLRPWLARCADELGIDFHGVTIRTQRGRWGSCSSRGRINLNAALLFLPPAWVRHVLVHELCHRRHLNHSPAFWALVARHDPDYATTRVALREAWQYVPGWLGAATRRR